MYTYYGIWIDHSKAFIVKANKMANMEVVVIGSDVESHHKGGNSAEHLSVINQHRHEERRHNEMKAFARQIIEHLKDADEIAIFGPSTAKFEFKNELEEHKDLISKLKSVETTDQLTENEIEEVVKTYFKLPAA